MERAKFEDMNLNLKHPRLLFAFIFMTVALLDSSRSLGQTIVQDKLRPIIEANQAKVISKSEISLLETPNRAVFDVRLSTLQLGEIPLIVNLPRAALGTGRTLPVIFMASGFQTASALSSYFGDDAGENILVLFQYPLDDKTDWKNWSNPKDQQNFINLLTKTPMQIASTLRWLLGTDLTLNFGLSADGRKTNTIAISLGGMFLPCGQRMAQSVGVTISGTVFAFTGADIKSLVSFYSETHPDDALAQILRPTLENLVAPFEPSPFISGLKSEFLILSAEEDQVFPKKSTEALIRVTPDPKQVIYISGNHIGLGQKERIRQSLMTIKQWLVEKQKANP